MEAYLTIGLIVVVALFAVKNIADRIEYYWGGKDVDGQEIVDSLINNNPYDNTDRTDQAEVDAEFQKLISTIEQEEN